MRNNPVEKAIVKNINRKDNTMKNMCSGIELTKEEIEKFEELKKYAREKWTKKIKTRKRAEKKIAKSNEGKRVDRLTVEEFEAYTGIMFSHNMSGKMEDVLAISTNCEVNPYCRARHLKGVGICNACYAQAYEKIRYSLRANTTLNAELLTQSIIPWNVIPKIYTDIVRIESFGDIANIIQAENYLRMAIVNPDVRFGWWTKNPNFIHKALQKYHNGEVPENVQVILSSITLNKEAKVNPKFKYFISKIFTVYTLCWFKENNIDMHSFINCGARSCKECQRCYHDSSYNIENKNNTIVVDDIEYVRELFKADARKVDDELIDD